MVGAAGNHPALRRSLVPAAEWPCCLGPPPAVLPGFRLYFYRLDHRPQGRPAALQEPRPDGARTALLFRSRNRRHTGDGQLMGHDILPTTASHLVHRPGNCAGGTLPVLPGRDDYRDSADDWTAQDRHPGRPDEPPER